MIKPPHHGSAPGPGGPAGTAELLPTAPGPAVAETLPMAARPAAATAGQLERAYLVVFEENTALTFELPKSGEVVIGRDPDVALPLGDRSASRQHAGLRIRSGEVWISDLASRNGTRVNGERITDGRQLIAGDVITICKASLIFYRQAAATSDASVYTVSQLRQRLNEEIDRAQRYHRPVSLLCLMFDHKEPDPAAVLVALGRPPAADGRRRVLWQHPAPRLVSRDDRGRGERHRGAHAGGAARGAGREPGRLCRLSDRWQRYGHAVIGSTGGGRGSAAAEPRGQGYRDRHHAEGR